jgi:hypothetical protein
MLSLRRESQMDKAKETLRDVISYADEAIRDERLRADIRAAVGHGAKASERVKGGIDSDGITTRLATDRKLRKHVRALLDDLDSASDRIRRKKGHRTRNVLLIGASAIAAIAAIANVRRWLAPRTPDLAGSDMHGGVTA